MLLEVTSLDAFYGDLQALHQVSINVDGGDTDARRFYERHGYANIEPGQDQPLFYYYRDLET